MQIIELAKHPQEELIDRIRQVRMLTQPEVQPYTESDISLEMFRPRDLAPPQRYVLAREVLKVRDLLWELGRCGVDLFKLDGYVSIRLAEDPEYTIDVLPPVVEESMEEEAPVPIINDGMHRIYLARAMGRWAQCVHIQSVPPQYPYYAFPLPDGWRDVSLVESIPEGYIKKWHRIKNYKSLYRDFNSAFQNVGGPRGHDPLPVQTDGVMSS